MSLASSLSPRHLLSDVARLVPIFSWLPHYDRSNLRADIVAGIAIWALVIPQHVAYAQIAGLRPEAGIFVSIWAPLVYAIFGTSRQLMCGPSSSTAIISAAHVATIARGDMRLFVTLSAALAVLAGVIFIVLGAFRLGFVSAFISSAVQIGFLFGLGLTIAMGQTFTLLDIPSVDGAFVDQARHLVRHVDEISWWSLGVGVVAFAVVLGIDRYWPRVPSALVVVVLGILAVTFFGLKDHRVATIGDIKGRLPDFEVPMISLSMWAQLLPGAVAIVLVCYSESTTIARRYADAHHYEVRPDQELVALGASSLVCGLFQGFCSSGGASQSAANDRNGARTQMTSLVLALLAALTAVILMPLLANLPFAVLAAIVINAVLGFFDFASARRVFRIRRASFLAGFLSFVAVLVGGILVGLVVGMGVSLLLLLVDLARPSVSEMAPVAHSDVLVPADSSAAQPLPGLLVVRPNAPLLYINAPTIRDEIGARLSTTTPPPRVLLLDLEESSSVDDTVLDMLESLQRGLSDLGAALWLCNVHESLLATLNADAVLVQHGMQVHQTVADAIGAFAPGDSGSPGLPGNESAR